MLQRPAVSYSHEGPKVNRVLHLLGEKLTDRLEENIIIVLYCVRETDSAVGT